MFHMADKAVLTTNDKKETIEGNYGMPAYVNEFDHRQYHTNSIESSWCNLKRLTHSFNGLKGNVFNTHQNLDKNDYFD